MSALLSLPVLYEKDDFFGRWEHTATIEDPRESSAVAGMTTTPQTAEWLVTEDLLLAVGDRGSLEPVVAFPLEDHLTAGTFSSGSQCIVDDPRPWYERSHMRVDWSLERAANLEALPLELDDPEVEPHGYLLDAMATESWPRFVRDADERLTELEVWTSYWVRCTGCTEGEVVVSHRFRRLD